VNHIGVIHWEGIGLLGRCRVGQSARPSLSCSSSPTYPLLLLHQVGTSQPQTT
jgi:hypothetical protein